MVWFTVMVMATAGETYNADPVVQATADLDWTPEFSLVEGLTDSYEKDFGRGTFRKEADFTTDDMILEKVKGKEPALA